MSTPDPYTAADVNTVALAVARTLGVDPFAVSGQVARAALDALAAGGRLAHDCDRACPFEDLWNGSDPKPDEAVARLQAAFNDAVSEISDLYAERDRIRAELARQVEETMEIATDLAKERTTADEMTRAVKRLVAERDDARAEAEGARSDYEQLRGFNAELADERDGLKRLLSEVRLNEATSRQRG